LVAQARSAELITRRRYEWSSPSGADIAPQPCIRWACQCSPTTMQLCASAAKLRTASPFCTAAMKANVGHGISPPRIVWSARHSRADTLRNGHSLKDLILTLRCDVLVFGVQGNTRRHFTSGHQPP
jgi:hypothetical protein